MRKGDLFNQIYIIFIFLAQRSEGSCAKTFSAARRLAVFFVAPWPMSQ